MPTSFSLPDFNWSYVIVVAASTLIITSLSIFIHRRKNYNKTKIIVQPLDGVLKSNTIQKTKNMTEAGTRKELPTSQSVFMKNGGSLFRSLSKSFDKTTFNSNPALSDFQVTNKEETVQPVFEVQTLKTTQSHTLPGFLHIKTDDFVIGELISRAEKVAIYKVKVLAKDVINRAGEEKMTLKKVESNDTFTFNQEVAIMALFASHPNFVRIIGYNEETCSIIQISYNAGSLLTWITSSKRKVSKTFELFSGLVEAIVVLHQSGVVHNDIKLENILLQRSTHKLVPKLTNFMESKIVENIVLRSRDLKFPRVKPSSITTTAPERFRAKPNSDSVSSVLKAGDVYSSSIVLSEIILGKQWLN